MDSMVKPPLAQQRMFHLASWNGRVQSALSDHAKDSAKDNMTPGLHQTFL